MDTKQMGSTAKKEIFNVILDGNFFLPYKATDEREKILALGILKNKAKNFKRTEIHNKQTVSLEAGEGVMSSADLAELLNWHKSKAHRFLETLENLKYIEIKQKSYMGTKYKILY